MAERLTRVLLVEDDPDDALLLRDMLGDMPSAGLELDHVDSLAAAFESLEQTRFDVVLLDLTLPDSRGLETFTKLRERAPDVPVVVLTGLQDETVAVGAVTAGAQDYLMKGEVRRGMLVRSIRYAIERQRTSHYQAVLLERERFDTAIEEMGDGIVVTDGDWRITTTNRAACLLLNLPEDACTGRLLDEPLSAFELSTPPAELRAGKERLESFEVARTETRPPLYLAARLTRLLGPSGDLESAVLVLRDVTEERREQQMRASFLMMVSHKLRTPLTVLVACLELCKRLPPERVAEQLASVMDVCDTEVGRLRAIVEQLLDFKALSTSDVDGGPESADIEATVADVVGDVRRVHAAKRVEFSVDVAPEAQLAGCSEEHLTLVLGELIGNAVKFGDKEPVRVEVKARRDSEGRVVVSVSDNGPGIPHEYYDRVFDSFVQVEDLPTGQVPGLGVGLHMAQKVVEACGGTISVTSEIGEGSTFSVALPARSAKPGQDT